mgnify:CR=1 FL=1
MITIKSRLDFIIKEEKKFHTLSSFKTKDRPQRKVKDLTPAIDKVLLVQNQLQEQNKNIVISGNLEKKVKPLKALPEKKKKPVVWL